MLNVSIAICRRDPRLDAEGTLKKARKTNAVMINIESISSGPREIGKAAMFLQTTLQPTITQTQSSNAAWGLGSTSVTVRPWAQSMAQYNGGRN